MKGEPEGVQGSQLCSKGVTRSAVSLPPPPSYCRHRDFELLQTTPNINRAKHSEEAHKMLTTMHPLSVRRKLSPQQNPKPR